MVDAQFSEPAVSSFSGGVGAIWQRGNFSYCDATLMLAHTHKHTNHTHTRT